MLEVGDTCASLLELTREGYILGEFGHLIANEDGCSPIEQFQALHSKVNFCTAPTRALLLTTYIKVRHSPHICPS